MAPRQFPGNTTYKTYHTQSSSSSFACLALGCSCQAAAVPRKMQATRMLKASAPKCLKPCGQDPPALALHQLQKANQVPAAARFRRISSRGGEGQLRLHGRWMELSTLAADTVVKDGRMGGRADGRAPAHAWFCGRRSESPGFRGNARQLWGRGSTFDLCGLEMASLAFEASWQGLTFNRNDKLGQTVVNWSGPSRTEGAAARLLSCQANQDS